MKYRSLRWVCEFPTIVWIGQRAESAEIRSISHTGARLFCNLDLTLGDKIELKCLLEKISASVVWVEKDYCGVKFLLPLGDKQLDIIRKPGGNGPTGGYVAGQSGHGHGFRELK